MHKSANYFDPPHGGRPPSQEAITKATQKYVVDKRQVLVAKASRKLKVGKSK